MNINESNNDNELSNSNESVRNIIINKKKDKKGNKKRHLNLSNNSNLGLNILKENYDLKIENNESSVEENLKTYQNNVHEQKNTDDFSHVENNSMSNKDDICLKCCDNISLDNTENDTHTQDNNDTHTQDKNDTHTQDNNDTHTQDNNDTHTQDKNDTHTRDNNDTQKQDIVNSNVINDTNSDCCKTKINSNIIEIFNQPVCNQLSKVYEISNVKNTIEESNVIDITNKVQDFNGQFVLVYAETDINQNDIVEINSNDNKLYVRPLSSNNNNFYGIAVHAAEKNSKVKILTNGICRIKLYNNIKLPIVRLVNGKFIMMRDQKNNVYTQNMSINVNVGDILIPMKNDDDLICGPKSVLSMYNPICGSHMIPYKNIIFNNNNCNYNISMNNKISIGMRFAYVISSDIKDDTIFVRI